MTKIKICGLTNLADAQFALECGADLLGFIFYKPSPRYVEPKTVKHIIETLKNNFSQSTTQFVGVFVNHSLDFVKQTLQNCQLDLAQLHGDEGIDFIKQLNSQAFKATNPRSLKEAQIMAQTFSLYPPTKKQAKNKPVILLDAYHPHLRGGTGHTTDWDMAAQLAKMYPILLAGGLNLDNIVQAIKTVKPWGVDVSSGVEASKGKKDHTKVKAFIQKVKMTADC